MDVKNVTINEKKAHEIVSKQCEWIAEFIEENNLSKEDRNQLRFKTYDTILGMAEWKDEELKKDILELEAKNDVLKSCLSDKKSEIEILRHRIEAEKTYRMQIENAVRNLPNSVKDLIMAFNMMF